MERYLLLGLRLGRHIDGFVDAYYGPSELSARVDEEDQADPTGLAAEAAALAKELDGFEEQRRHWLLGQIRGCETVARRLAGEPLSWAEEVERCYGVRPKRVPENRFEAAHRALEEVLPGDGSLAERYQAWRETDTLSGDALARVTDSLAEDLRSRTEKLVGLPEGESVHFEYVSDEPWSAYNYYLGELHSKIAVNTDVPLTPTFLIELVAHETYPGHHTEHSWKERLLYRDDGRLEESILMIGTPHSLVSEGIASLAPEMALGGEEPVGATAHGLDYRRVRRAGPGASAFTGKGSAAHHAGAGLRRRHQRGHR